MERHRAWTSKREEEHREKREDERGKKEEGRWGIVQKKKKKNRTSKRDRRRKRGIRMTAGTKQSAPHTSLFPQAMPARDCCSVLDSRSRTFTNTYEHVWACIGVYTDCDTTASRPGEREIVHHSPTHKYSKSFCGSRVYSRVSHSSFFQENCPFCAIHEEPYFMRLPKKLDNFKENKEARTFPFLLFHDSGLLRFIGLLYL